MPESPEPWPQKNAKNTKRLGRTVFCVLCVLSWRMHEPRTRYDLPYAGAPDGYQDAAVASPAPLQALGWNGLGKGMPVSSAMNLGGLLD